MRRTRRARGPVTAVEGSDLWRNMPVVLVLVLVLALVVACTYGPPEDRLAVQNVAVKPDGSRVAVVVLFERRRMATGLAAFPDGGRPKMLEQRADVYVLSLPARTVLSRNAFPAPDEHFHSFRPWASGWEGDTLFVRLSGCPRSADASCHGSLRQVSTFAIDPDGRARSDDGARTPTLLNTLSDGASYLSVGTERDGVSIGTRLGQPRTPLMRFSGQDLEPVRP